jgi:hypothetical protein
VTARHTIQCAAIALALSGCSALGNSTTTATTRADSNVARAQAAHEYPSPPPPQTTGNPAAGPQAAIDSFATQYINWRAGTVAARMRSLAAQSVGQARSAMQLAAGNVAGDYELQRGGIANSGSVEAIAPRAGHPHQYVVVTLERTTATATTAYQGLRPAWHITLATVVQQRPGEWAVSGWQPES